MRFLSANCCCVSMRLSDEVDDELDDDDELELEQEEAADDRLEEPQPDEEAVELALEAGGELEEPQADELHEWGGDERPERLLDVEARCRSMGSGLVAVDVDVVEVVEMAATCELGAWL